MDLSGLTALLSAFLAALGGNHGGLALAFLLIAGLGWKLRQCEKKHDVTLDQNARLAAACMQMGTTVNVLCGNRVVEVGSLDDILAGKSAVKYVSKPEMGRRRGDQKPDDPAGGDGHVSA